VPLPVAQATGHVWVDHGPGLARGEVQLDLAVDQLEGHEVVLVIQPSVVEDQAVTGRGGEADQRKGKKGNVRRELHRDEKNFATLYLRVQSYSNKHAKKTQQTTAA